MKLILVMLATVVMGASQCKKSVGIQAPDCVIRKIETIRDQKKWNPPAEVHEYEYKGKTVYLFTADCCDQYITLVDGDCNYICAPSGGFTGAGDGLCKDFYESSVHKRLVWKDGR